MSENTEMPVVDGGEATRRLKDCPTYRPITPVVRIGAMEQRLDAMLRATNIVQPVLQKFYGSLTDEQKERFNPARAGAGMIPCRFRSEAAPNSGAISPTIPK